MKVILLNAPPDSGKDALAEHLTNILPNATKCEFKRHLYRVAASIAGISTHDMEYLNRRETKETPNPALPFNYSPRKWLIHVSEVIIKPSLGQNYFGDIAARYLRHGFVHVFSDSGFMTEADSIIKTVGLDNILLVQIHRPDRTFQGDSRTFLPAEQFKHVFVLNNDNSRDHFFDLGAAKIHQWLRQVA